MSAIRVRLAEEADNDMILALARRCPQEGMITFFPNRTPRYNSVHRLIDPEAWHMAACRDNDIIGLVGVVHFQANVMNQARKMAYMLDFKVDKEYRSGVTTFRLVKTAVDHLTQSDADMAIVNVLKDNKRPLVFTTGRGGLPASLYLGDNRIFNIIPLRFMKPDVRFQIGALREEDIPEVIKLYHKYASGFRISPVITEERFRNYFLSLDGFSADRFLVARENGKIKAVTALWDEHTYKAYQVLKLNFSIRMATGILKLLSPFMRVPRPIRLNEPLRQLSLVLFAHDDCPEALDTLFRHANNISLGSDYTMITLYAQEHDPIFLRMKKFTGVTVKSEMHLFAKDVSMFEELQKNPSPVWMDLSMTL